MSQRSFSKNATETFTVPGDNVGPKTIYTVYPLSAEAVSLMAAMMGLAEAKVLEAVNEITPGIKKQIERARMLQHRQNMAEHTVSIKNATLVTKEEGETVETLVDLETPEEIESFYQGIPDANMSVLMRIMKDDAMLKACSFRDKPGTGGEPPPEADDEGRGEGSTSVRDVQGGE